MGDKISGLSLDSLDAGCTFSLHSRTPSHKGFAGGRGDFNDEEEDSYKKYVREMFGEPDVEDDGYASNTGNATR